MPGAPPKAIPKPPSGTPAAPKKEVVSLTAKLVDFGRFPHELNELSIAQCAKTNARAACKMSLLKSLEVETVSIVWLLFILKTCQPIFALDFKVEALGSS